MKTKLSILTLAMLPLLSVSVAQANAPEIFDDTLIVVYKENATKMAKIRARNSVGASISDLNRDEIDDRFKNLMEGRIANLKLRGKSVKEAIEILNKNPDVAYVEPNYVWTHALAPNDPGFGDLWGLNNTGQDGGVEDADIDAAEAWEVTTGSSDVIVAVIDGGVDYTHPDLVANMWQNPGEIAGDGIDNDGNGYIDDIYGIDTFYDDSDPMDANGHGTHVAGTIGAVGNNGIGVVGVNHDVSIIACKFLDENRGSTVGAIECIDYLTGLKNNGVNIRASNNSWGGGGFSQALQDSIVAGGEAGILFIAAAGNAGEDNDALAYYPASYDNDIIVSVASTTRTDGDSGYSFGVETVDLAAPGTAVVSTYLNDGYASLSGTSMATPHVTGTAALVWSINPQLTALEMKQLLMETGDDNVWATGRTVSGKRLNANNALEAADPVPGFSFNVYPVNQQITAGESASFTFGLNSIAGFGEEITLTLEDATGLGVLSASTALPGDSVTLDVTTAEDTPWGPYEMTVSGVSGDIEKAKTVGLYVLPQGLTTFPFESTDTPLDTLPAENDPNRVGMNSVLNIADEITVFGMSVSVDITHTWSGDLVLTLISPAGTSAILRENEGDGIDDIVETFTTDAFNREVATGDWLLNIIDTAADDNGILNSWNVEITGISEVAPAAPRAGFSFSDDGLAVTFTNESTDVNNDIVSHAWDFGDGNTSNEASPSHTFSATGSYDVTLTTTDAEGQADSVTETISVASKPIEVTVDRAFKSRFGNLHVDLSFTGTSSETVSVFRNDEMIWSGKNKGIFRDRSRRVTGILFTYVICDETEVCSDPVDVAF